MSELKPSDRSSPAPRRTKRQVVPGQHAQADGLELRSYDVGALPLLNRIVERMQLQRILSEHLPSDDSRTELPTVTALLAVRATKGGKRVALFDLNGDQGDLTQWYALRDKPRRGPMFLRLIPVQKVSQDVEVCRADPRVVGAVVEVRKMHPPVRALVDYVAVRVEIVYHGP